MENVPPFEMSWHDIPKMRVEMGAMQAQRRQAANVRFDNVQTVPITMRDGHHDSVLLVKPDKPPAEGSPLIMLVFGGGFVVGTKEEQVVNAQTFQEKFGATVVCATYRLAPEHKFPTAPHDAWDCFDFALKNAESFGASISAGLIVGGISAGGNLAAAVARKAVEEGVPLTGAWLCIPSLLDKDTVPQKYKNVFLSREQNANAMIINQKAIDHITEAYQRDPWSKDYTPFAYSDPAGKMPPTFIQVCGQDPLRDDGLIYARVLQEAEVSVRLDIYPGVPHGFHGFFQEFKQAQKWQQDTVDGMSWLLQKGGK